ncbi:hypothetical protein OGAPHI_000495 [Ogataea philodendri]|uniref:Uncharacterized protein n=1 Tax=Ogataea philodendri TaxID=1378263 RepID=A0A9P8PG73_9ASCO|nr:uncharacterized protein OGAPHI_000495 [Ogataea philodendri]KAH3671272.1 hypothetical protein OGAPHI_000495 [Ogataea philodendri]
MSTSSSFDSNAPATRLLYLAAASWSLSSESEARYALKSMSSISFCENALEAIVTRSAGVSSQVSLTFECCNASVVNAFGLYLAGIFRHSSRGASSNVMSSGTYRRSKWFAVDSYSVPSQLSFLAALAMSSSSSSSESLSTFFDLKSSFGGPSISSCCIRCLPYSEGYIETDRIFPSFGTNPIKVANKSADVIWSQSRFTTANVLVGSPSGTPSWASSSSSSSSLTTSLSLSLSSDSESSETSPLARSRTLVVVSLASLSLSLSLSSSFL